MLIKNYSSLATSPTRKTILDIIEIGLEAIQPEKVLEDLRLEGDTLILPDGSFYALDTYQRVFLLGFGKGSAEISKIIEGVLGGKLTAGWVIDVGEGQKSKVKSQNSNSKVKITIGTHPLPSETNAAFTRDSINQLTKLTPSDLILVVICGGGSALFTDPTVSLETLVNTNKELLKSGMNIAEMNTIRKHLDSVKGGGLAKRLFPAGVVSLIFSDVPGNDLSVIASGPTVKDPSTVDEAWGVLGKLGILGKSAIKKDDLVETPKEEKFFEKVQNVLMLSNLTALLAMKSRAEELGYVAEVYSDHLQGEAREVGKELVSKVARSTSSGQAGQQGRRVLIAGGETTVTVHGNGEGGRNQELVLGAVKSLSNIVVASVGSDGWDNSPFAGAIGDKTTLEKAQNLNLDPQKFLDNNDSYNFFRKVGDGVETGKLPSNVSDLIVVVKT